MLLHVYNLLGSHPLMSAPRALKTWLFVLSQGLLIRMIICIIDSYLFAYFCMKHVQTEHDHICAHIWAVSISRPVSISSRDLWKKS
jgi:hypothetical protein